MARLVHQVEPEYWSLKTAEIYTGRSHWCWRRDANAGRIASVKIGTQPFLPIAEIKRVMNQGTRPRIENPSNDAAPPRDVAGDAFEESAELPESNKPAAPEAPPRRLYPRQKSTPAKAG
jgi:hypothetical protein